MRRGKGRYMIKVSIVFIIGKNEDGFFPYLGIFCQNIHHFTDIPGTIPGRRWVIGKVLRCYDPRYCRKLTVLHILAELVKNISPGNVGFTRGISISIFQRSKLVIRWVVAIIIECLPVK